MNNNTMSFKDAYPKKQPHCIIIISSYSLKVTLNENPVLFLCVMMYLLVKEFSVEKNFVINDS